ncbi:MAG: hypothetical protein VX454_07835 [Pseudomonadota bacterium]|jgi:hypothetical protein|nr:hypothetical protein [Pseudomonadota bacterium]
MKTPARLAPALSAIAMLSACSDENADRAGDARAPADPATTASAIPVEPDGGIGDGAGPPMAVADTIPARFRGVWDNAEGTCAPASDLRMDIRAGEIEFYESLGEVTSVETEGPDSIVVSLAMAGEGETWTVTSRYVLSDDGAILTPYETETNPRYQPIPRKRCPS